MTPTGAAGQEITWISVPLALEAWNTDRLPRAERRDAQAARCLAGKQGPPLLLTTPPSLTLACSCHVFCLQWWSWSRVSTPGSVRGRTLGS